MFSPEKKQKVLFVSSEAAPFVKVGGLGEVLAALPKALRTLGVDARIMVPNYAAIDKEKIVQTMLVEGLRVPSGGEEGDIICNVKTLANASADFTPCYFLENAEFYEKRGKVYGYDDDAARWALLSRGTLEFLRQSSDFVPDVIVACDWQGGLIPNFLKTVYKDDSVIGKIAVMFSIHNLYYQGMFNHRFISDLDYDDGQSTIPALSDPRLLKTNFMRRGIRYADIITTVSETYAREITTPEYGEGLDPILKERRSRLFGILNGIDYDSYSPESNPYIDAKYSARNIAKRAANKTILQKKFNLKEDDSIPLFAVVSRLSEQKGLGLLAEILPDLLAATHFQLIILGTGDSKLMTSFADLEKVYPEVKTHLSFDSLLPHLIYAGADVILVPSKFEPSGLTQMEAMRYGALPLVRKTGGLADSVEDYTVSPEGGTGFVFEAFNKYALFASIVRAIETYKYKDVWTRMQKRAMEKNFSWQKSAEEYIRLFKKAVAFREEPKK